MERKVGEIFTYKGKTYQVMRAISGCSGCAFCRQACTGVTSMESCSATSRIDNTSVIFKEINNMENNQLTIDIPKGMEIDIKDSDLTKGIIKFKPTNIDYDDIKKALNLDRTLAGIPADISNANKLCAIDKLMNIAKYYNKDWKPSWNNRCENKYFIIWNNECKTYWTDYNRNSGLSIVYFKNKEDAQSVIDNPNFRAILDEIYKY